MQRKSTPTAMYLLLAIALCIACPPAQAEDAYDYVWAYHGGVAQFERDGKIGMIDEAGHVVAEAVYDFIFPYTRYGYRLVQRDGLWTFLDARHEPVTDRLFEITMHPNDLKEPLFFFEENGLYGRASMWGEVIFEPEWTEIPHDYFWTTAVVFGVRYPGAVLTDGTGLAACEWTEVRVQHPYCLSSNRQIRIGGEFESRTEEGPLGSREEEYPFVSACYAYLTDGLWEMEDERDGEFMGRWAERFRGWGFVLVELDGKWGVVDIERRELVTAGWDEMYILTDMYWLEAKDGHWTVTDAHGHQERDIAEYESAYRIDPDVYNGGNIELHHVEGEKSIRGIVDEEGNWVKPPRWKMINNFREGLASARDEEGYTYLDMEANAVFEERWDYAKDFSEGYASVEKGGKYAYINRAGELMTGYIFDLYAGRFEGGLASVSIGGKEGFLNSEFEYVSGLKKEI